MNAQQENKLSMYLAVKAVCDKKQAVWQTLPAFNKAYQNFIAHVATIQSLTKQQVRRKTGVAEDKQRVRLDMVAAAYPIAAAVKAYAVDVKNRELVKRVSYSRSELMIGRDTVSADRCREVYAAATENLGNLADFGMTAAKLAALQALIDAYATAISKPRETRAVSKTVTGNLAVEFSTADEILKQRLDNLMPQLGEKDATFVADYRNARAIVDAAASRSSAEPAKPAAAGAPA